MQFSIYRKADNQLNAICRLQTYIDQKEKEATINTFLNSHLNYPSFLLLFSLQKSQKISKQ